jgi:hypothetical protein
MVSAHGTAEEGCRLLAAGSHRFVSVSLCRVVLLGEGREQRKVMTSAVFTVNEENVFGGKRQLECYIN